MATHSSILGLDRAVVSHGQRRLAGYSPWGPKESDMTEHARARAHTHTHTHTHTEHTVIHERGGGKDENLPTLQLAFSLLSLL